MIGDVVAAVCIYLTFGIISGAMGAIPEIAGDDNYLAVGYILLWPLFILKGILWLVWFGAKEIKAGIKKNIHKWFIVPYSIGKMFKNTFLYLFGVYKPEKSEVEYL